MYTLLAIALAVSILANVILARRAKGLKAAQEYARNLLEMMTIVAGDADGTIRITASWEDATGEQDTLYGLLHPERVDKWRRVVEDYVNQTDGRNLQIGQWEGPPYIDI